MKDCPNQKLDDSSLYSYLSKNLSQCQTLDRDSSQLDFFHKQCGKSSSFLLITKQTHTNITKTRAKINQQPIKSSESNKESNNKKRQTDRQKMNVGGYATFQSPTQNVPNTRKKKKISLFELLNSPGNEPENRRRSVFASPMPSLSPHKKCFIPHIHHQHHAVQKNHQHHFKLSSPPSPSTPGTCATSPGSITAASSSLSSSSSSSPPARHRMTAANKNRRGRGIDSIVSPLDLIPPFLTMMDDDDDEDDDDNNYDDSRRLLQFHYSDHDEVGVEAETSSVDTRSSLQEKPQPHYPSLISASQMFHAWYTSDDDDDDDNDDDDDKGGTDAANLLISCKYKNSRSDAISSSTTSTTTTTTTTTRRRLSTKGRLLFRRSYR
jgi:hypothetical protein